MDYVNSSTNSAQQTTELYIKRVLAGNIDEVRARLIASMESLGYDIIEEEPNVIGRRGARGWGPWFASADVLDYPMTLTVRLKALTGSSTRATFDYLIKHPMLNRGEKNIVVQEAKTIAAISKMQSIEKLCPVCEMETTDDSRFCRKCGAPLTTESSELEVLRMMAETRAGKTSIVATSIFSVVGSILVLLGVILNNAELLKPKLFGVMIFVGGLFLLFSIISSFFGWNRVKRALEKPESEPRVVHGGFPEVLETVEIRKLPDRQQEPASVTEGTTNLLDNSVVNNRQREKIPVNARHETNDLE